ncbi:class I SAM-dependent methyltransferase [Persephonella sp.]
MKFFIEKEDSYGYLKRLRFVSDIVQYKLENSKSIKILDVGCGTGLYLSIPLANMWKDKVYIFGFDIDIPSINFLKDYIERNSISNIKPISNIAEIKNEKFDIVIISEVLEHVESPINFLREFTHYGHEETLYLITIPNGYGIFEIDSLFYNILRLQLRILKNFKNKIFPKSNIKNQEVTTGATCSESPHINFFTYCAIKNIFYKANLEVIKYKGRTFACGPIISRLINRFDILIRINSFLGEKLPPQFVSGWMFVLKKSSVEYKKSKDCIFYNSICHKIYSRLKVYINKQQ